jgi:hypothetical protein
MLAVVSRCSSALEEEGGRNLIAKERAPTVAEREHLARRRRTLSAALARSDDTALSQLIARHLVSYRGYGNDAAAAAMMLADYVEALRDLPMWAIEMALSNIKRGRVQVIKPLAGRQPTPDVIAAEARGARPIVRGEDGAMLARMSVLDIEAELSRLIRVLDATVYGQDTTPAERQIALARWAEIKRQMAAAAAMPEPIEPGPEPDPIPAAEKPEGEE